MASGRTAGKQLAIAALATALLAAAQAGAAPADLTANRLVNPGAEDGLTGWEGTGFGLTQYGAGGVSRYSPPGLGTLPRTIGGDLLFEAGGPGSIAQAVDFSDRTAEIDAGVQHVYFGALLGGRDEQPGGGRFVIQPLDAFGAALGVAHAVGYPSVADRGSATTLLGCDAEFQAPIGMRTALARLEAVGQGLADEPFVRAQRPPQQDILREPRPVPAEGAGCMKEGPTGDPLPGPAPLPPASTTLQRPPASIPRLESVVVMPASDRCGRSGALRFSVRRTWRSRVTSVTVSARGRRVVRPAGRVIAVSAPRGRLRVGVRVRLRDGRMRVGVRWFSGCG